VLHWIIALLFLGVYSAFYYREWFTQRGDPAHLTSIRLHFTFGISIGIFVILRIIWRFTHRPPDLLPAPRLERFAAHAVHGLLYLFMIGMPLTGYLGTKGGGGYWGFPAFPDTALYQWLVTDTLGLTWDDWRKPFGAFHFFSGENLVWVLILIHIAAAVYHQFLKRDRLMQRMWF
jgi:cytochrome b561